MGFLGGGDPGCPGNSCLPLVPIYLLKIRILLFVLTVNLASEHRGLNRYLQERRMMLADHHTPGIN